MFTVLMILIILLSIAITAAILMQNPKGGGLSSAFGGSGGLGTMLGVRHASDILAKTTWGLAIAFTVLIFAVNMFFLPSAGTQESIIQRSGAEAPISPMEKQQQMQQQAAPPAGAQQAPPPAGGQQAPPPADNAGGQTPPPNGAVPSPAN